MDLDKFEKIIVIVLYVAILAVFGLISLIMFLTHEVLS